MAANRALARNRSSAAMIVARWGLLVVAMLTSFRLQLPAAAAASYGIQVRSSRPDLVSGGEALVQVSLPAATSLSAVQVRLNTLEVTGAFHPVAGHAWLARLQHLPLGQSTLSLALASAPSQVLAAQTLTDYPVAGPIFSGPHQTPFVCQTQASGLGTAKDADCFAPTQYLFYYESVLDHAFHRMLIPTVIPWDTAKTTTLNGVTVNFVVRVEQGVIDRGIYQIATLFDPSKGWEPWAPQPAWNGRLLYRFGISCGPGYHQGIANAGDVLAPDNLNDEPLAEGFAVATSTLDVFGDSCNSTLAAEAMMMTKAHFIAEYGVPRYTMGWGTSGGAMAQYLIADEYPGLLDGIVPDLSMADMGSAGMADCSLLVHYLANAAGWSGAQQAAVSGAPSFSTCAMLDTIFGKLSDPSTGCDSSVPGYLIYDPVWNPNGARCTVVDDNVNALGTDPSTGFARNPFDNVGVQYGLAALNAGTISVDQFLDLNAKIGGFDANGNPTASRSVGDPIAIANSYQDGLILNGGLGLASTPIIDFRTATQGPILADIHPNFQSFTVRQRLQDANGDADNQLLWQTAPGLQLWLQEAPDAFAAMTQWLDNVTADTSSRSLRDKVLLDKPAGLGDRCYLDPSNPHSITPGTCTRAVPMDADPRIVAGEPLVHDIVKCRLTPVDMADYAVPFTPAQQARLQAIFASGVCDYSQPGVAQQPPLGPWVSLGPAH